VYGHSLYRAKFIGGYRLVPGESKVARMTIAAATPKQNSHTEEGAEVSPARQALGRLTRRHSAMIGLIVISFFIAMAVLANIVARNFWCQSVIIGGSDFRHTSAALGNSGWFAVRLCRRPN
jgi:oligopeptide transport permease C-like protein